MNLMNRKINSTKKKETCKTIKANIVVIMTSIYKTHNVCNETILNYLLLILMIPEHLATFITDIMGFAMGKKGERH